MNNNELNIFIFSKHNFVKDLISQLYPSGNIIGINQAHLNWDEVNLDQNNIIITELNLNLAELDLIFPVIEISIKPQLRHSYFLPIPFRYNDLREKIGLAKSSFNSSRKSVKLNEKFYLYYNSKKLVYKNSDNIELISLTSKETELLKFLYSQPQKFASKSLIQEEVFGYSEKINSHTVETHIYRIRNKNKYLRDLIVLKETNNYGLLQD